MFHNINLEARGAREEAETYLHGTTLPDFTIMISPLSARSSKIPCKKVHEVQMASSRSSRTSS